VRARKLVLRTLALACASVLAVPAASAVDPDGAGDHVSRQDVADARAAVAAKADDVDSVRARLAQAEQRLEAAQVTAAKAAEAFNGARYESQQAAEALRHAQQEAEAAAADLARQRAAYAEAVTSAYQMSPQLGALGALSHADGVTDVLESTAALQNAEAALQDRYDAYHDAVGVAEAAESRADDALADARAATERARKARDQAEAAEASAAAVAGQYAAERDQLIAQLARLQDTSVELAEQRQDQLEAAAAAAAAAAAQEQAEEEAQQEAQQQPPAPDPTPAAEPTPAPAPSVQPTPAPTPPPAPDPSPEPTTPPSPPTPPPPAPSGDAAAAIAFAREQLGEPYSYGAAGPNRWDCSGLTMRAWQAGGKSLPHYSVAQYQQSTPITLGELQPGDLLFWSERGASSIYHVAIYTGDGMMIHAPRPGRSVEEVSIYYWITPNLFARP
jgi:cell wall-associated NlpC family hydrolase